MISAEKRQKLLLAAQTGMPFNEAVKFAQVSTGTASNYLKQFRRLADPEAEQPAIHRPAAKKPESGEEFVAARKAARVLVVQNHPERPEIRSDIPVPQENRGGLRKFDNFYPFQDMQPGDSFWVPSSTGCTPGAVTKFSKKSGWRFTTRAQSEDGRNNSQVGKEWRGTRVWRVA